MLPRSGLVRFFKNFSEPRTGPSVRSSKFYEPWTEPQKNWTIGLVQVLWCSDHEPDPKNQKINYYAKKHPYNLADTAHTSIDVSRLSVWLNGASVGRMRALHTRSRKSAHALVGVWVRSVCRWLVMWLGCGHSSKE